MDHLIEQENRILIEEIPEKFYEELYSKADILYFKLDEHYQVISCNITAEEKLAYEQESLSGNSLLNFLAETSQDQVRKALQTCFHKGYIKDIEFQLQTQDRQIIECLMNGLTYQDSDESRFIRLYIRDITKFKHAYLANQLLSTVIDSFKHKDKENIIYQNISSLMSCEGAGISLRLKDGESIISGFWDNLNIEKDYGARDFRRWHPQIWSLFIQKCQNSGAGQWTETGSFWTGYLKETISILHAQGEKQAFESLEQYESLALISLNDSQSQQGYFILVDQQAAQWDENIVQLFESLSHDLTSAVIPHDSDENIQSDSEMEIYPWLNVPIFGVMISENGIIRHINPWIESHIGIPSEKMIGKSINEIISNEFHDLLQETDLKSIPVGHFKNLGTLTFHTYQGGYKHVECMLTTIPLGKTLCELWYWLEHKEELDFLSRLQESKKMEALGILTGGIVHDFDNLLSTIIGFTTILKEEIGNKSPLIKDVLQISDTAEKAVELTSRLLAYAQGKSYIVTHLNLNKLVNEVAGILSRTLDKNIIIRADLEKDLYSIKADAGQIQQMILHVALNAKEAMPHGGSMVFQTRNLQLNQDDPRLKKECKPGNYIQVVISDTGLGMSSQIKDQIFEPHFSTKEQAPGKGLGLTMVRQIVEQNGGFVSVFSEIGKGTVFKIQLPSNMDKMNRSGKRANHPGNNKATVLVIDNERIFRDTAKRILIRYGYSVLTAKNAHDGIEMLQQNRHDPQLILLDLIVSETDIKKVIDSFRKLNKEIKIFMTLKSKDKNKITSDLSKNFDGFIQKPFQLSILLKKVQNALQ